MGGNRFVISAKTEHPEAALRLADLMYSYDATIRGYHGVYGENWTDPDPGAVGLNGEPALYKVLTPGRTWTVQNNETCCSTPSPTVTRLSATASRPTWRTPTRSLAAALRIWLAEATKEYEVLADKSKPLPP